MSSQIKGATVPVWSGDGDSLLYVGNDGLWLDAALGRPPVEIAHPLFAPTEWPTFYGQVSFSEQFSCSSPTTASVNRAVPRE